MSKAILILDSLKYKDDEIEYESLIKKKFDDVNIFYTEYEDDLIRKVREIKSIGKFLQHILYWKKSYNYALNIVKNCTGASVICLNPIVGFFLGMLNKKNYFDLYLCGFLFEPKSNKFYYNLRKKLVVNILRNIKKVIVYSSSEVTYYDNIFNCDKFEFIHYGINYIETEKYEGELPANYIFSGGGSNRDYKTLFEAYNKTNTDIPLIVATHPHCVAGLYKNERIIVKNDVINETFGDILKRSRFLVLSLKDADISAGHMVFLQALKNNVPILINRIKAVEDYVTDKDVYFYESGNVEELSKMITYLLKEAEYKYTQDLYYNNFTFICLLRRLIELI